MKTGNTESRIPYLSLALLSQKVIDSLVQFREQKRKPESFEPSLQEALKTLKNAKLTHENQVVGEPRNVFSKYEHLVTLNEAWPEPMISEVIQDLEVLLNPGTPTHRQMVLASSLTERFFSLENQALSNFERPNDPVPKGIRALCKAV